MEAIVESNITTIDFSKDTPHVERKITRIISTKPIKRFTCRHCESVFATTEWYKTKGNNYGATCPCCSYSAWARR